MSFFLKDLFRAFKEHTVKYYNKLIKKLLNTVHYYAGKSLYRGKGMVRHVQLSTNYGFGCLIIANKYFF